MCSSLQADMWPEVEWAMTAALQLHPRLARMAMPMLHSVSKALLGGHQPQSQNAGGRQAAAPTGQRTAAQADAAAAALLVTTLLSCQPCVVAIAWNVCNVVQCQPEHPAE